MKKKLITLITGGAIALSLFAVSGSPVQAAPIINYPDCGCPSTSLTGEEKNMIIANLISSPVFKVGKENAVADGLIWRGLNNNNIKVEIAPGFGTIVGIPFYYPDGTFELAGFIKLEDTNVFLYGGHYPFE